MNSLLRFMTLALLYAMWERHKNAQAQRSIQATRKHLEIYRDRKKSDDRAARLEKAAGQ